MGTDRSEKKTVPVTDAPAQRRRLSDHAQLKELLAGDGEMATLMRARDWSGTPVGTFDQWPLALRTIVRTMLNSRHPMFLWWGPELVQFYNDAYVPSFGKGKHPRALGQPGRECWPEIWPIIWPQIEDVMTKGKPSWNVDQLVPIFRNGRIEDVYWTYGYSPVFDDNGEIAGTLVVCTETTERVLQDKAHETSLAIAVELTESQRVLRLMMEASGATTFSIDLQQKTLETDPSFSRFYRVKQETVLPLDEAMNRVNPADRANVETAIRQASRGDNGGRFLAERRILQIDGQERWIESRGQVTFSDNGVPLFLRGIDFDITARKQAEHWKDALLVQKESERARLQKLFEQAPAAICLLDGPDHRFAFTNARYRELVADRALLGKTVREALPELVTQGFIGLLDTVFQTGVPYEGRETWLDLQRKNESPAEKICLDFLYQPVPGADGKTASIFVHAVEVTALVRAREQADQAAAAVRAREQRLTEGLAVAATANWALEVATQAITTDPQSRVILGLPNSTLTLETVLATIHRKDRDRVAWAIASSLTARAPMRFEEDYRTQPATGTAVQWFALRGQTIHHEGGDVLRVAMTAQDITARKEAELRMSNILTTLANQSVFGVAVLRGPLLTYEMVNDTYRALVGNRDIAGKPLLSALPEFVGQGVESALRDVLRTGQAVEGSEVGYEVAMKEGQPLERRYFSYVWQPFASPGSGAADSILVISKDVTDAVRLRLQEAEQNRATHERADFERQLIGIVSHDLRNPLGTILLGVHNLNKNAALDARASKTVKRIQSSADRAHRMVRDLLDFTQARLGTGLPITPAPVNLAALVIAVCEEVRIAFPDRSLRTEIQGDIHGTWDFDRLTQVVSNLVSNALKYSEAGTTVTVRVSDVGDSVRLAVHNFGPEIQPEARARIFEPMQRGNVLNEPGGRSVGLGLFITRHIVEAHGGTVTLNSSAKTGTTFTVELPKQQASKDAPPPV